MTAATEESSVAKTEEVASTSPSQALVPRQDRAIAEYVRDVDAEGEFSSDDTVKPKLAVVAKTGKLSNIFTPGDFLLNGEYVIGGQKSPLDVVAVGIKKFYQNDLPYDPNEMADIVRTKMEVIERGGTSGYRPFGDDKSTNFWKPVLQILFLIKSPENLSPDAAALFPYEIDGNDYTVAGFWASAKTAFMGVASPLIEAKLAKGSVRLSSYRLSTKGKENNDGSRSWIQTSLRATGPTPVEILNFLDANNG